MYKTTPGTHADYPALLLLSCILAGGFSSRLQRALVDRGLVSDVGVFCHEFFDTGFMSFTAQAAQTMPANQVLTLMRKEIAKVSTDITQEEVDYAKERLLAEIAGEYDGVFKEIRTVSEATAAGDWALVYKIEEAIQKSGPKRCYARCEKILGQK